MSARDLCPPLYEWPEYRCETGTGEDWDDAPGVLDLDAAALAAKRAQDARDHALLDLAVSRLREGPMESWSAFITRMGGARLSCWRYTRLDGFVEVSVGPWRTMGRTTLLAVLQALRILGWLAKGEAPSARAWGDFTRRVTVVRVRSVAQASLLGETAVVAGYKGYGD